MAFECRSSRTAHPPVARMSAFTMPSTPWPSRTARVRVCSASSDRESRSYCSATRRVNTASVMAMKGTGYGTSNSGNDARSAASASAFGTERKEKPVPKPSPASPAAVKRLRYARCFPGVDPTPIPVVKSSSPPLSHGVGSSSSLTCTQRMGLPEPALPAASRISRPGMWSRSPTVRATPGLYGSYKAAV